MTIGLISPASAAKDKTLIDKGIARLKSLGYRVKEGRSIRTRHGYLAAPDAARLADINAMFADPKVDAIMCVRGGYGTGRIASQIDYEVARQNPKIFIGFSDVTMLSLAFWKKIKLVTFSGPMLLSTFAKDQPSAYTTAGFARTLTAPEAPGSIWQNHADRNYRVVRHGKAAGRLIGGNLSLVAASIGTPFEIDTKRKIVFLEDVDEQPYRVDRMLTQLLQSGKLLDAAGIVFGRNVPDAESAEHEKKRTLDGRMGRTASPPSRKAGEDFEHIIDDVIADLLAPLGIPVVIGLPFGHITDYATMPIGVHAELNTRTGDLVIDEAAVR